MLPDPVGHHASRQWIVGRSDPVRQHAAAARGLRLRLGRGDHHRLRIQHRWKRWCDCRAADLRIASQQHKRLRRLRSMLADGQCMNGLAVGQDDGHLDLRAVLRHRRQIVEKRQQAVVVLLSYRIDLMVVAARTVDRQAQESLADGGQQIVELVVPRQQPVRRFVVPDAQPVKAGRNDRIGTRRRQFVARQLLADELIIRLVVVQRADDVIAISPGMRLDAVALEAVRLRETDQVEPVSRPTLAVVRRVQQVVDDLSESLRRIVRQKLRDRFGRRRQSSQIEICPAQQCQAISRRSGGQATVFQSRQNKGIDRVPHPIGANDRRRLRSLGRLKCPMLLPRGTLLDPAAQDADLLVRQRWFVRRHSLPFLVRGDPPDQFAGLRIAGHDRCQPRIGRGEGRFTRRQTQTALCIARPVALEAVLGQNRLHLACEIHQRRLLSGYTGGCYHEQQYPKPNNMPHRSHCPLVIRGRKSEIQSPGFLSER